MNESELKSLADSYKKAKRSGSALPFKTDKDILHQTHRFIRDSNQAGNRYEKTAVDLYNKLYKEYCVCDLSRYKEGKIGLRWRTAEEVKASKGEGICGNLRCDRIENLKSMELNFGYAEDEERKNALVKARLCRKCRHKLRKAKRVKESTDNE
jgi:protein FRA10AC1